MRKIDPKAFGERVRERMKDTGHTQITLGAAVGLKQQSIGYYVSGEAKRPQRIASELADALQTTREWLLWKEGPKHVGPRYLATSVLAEKYDSLPPEMKASITQLVEKAQEKHGRKIG